MTALDVLHSHNPNPINHSDLKPANIMLGEGQKVAKILDFGLSKSKSASYGSVGTVRTLLYHGPIYIYHIFRESSVRDISQRVNA
jgi:serine/threonine protein kinase